MTTELEIFYGQLTDAMSRNDEEAGRRALHRFSRARSKQVKPRPEMETFNRPRKPFMQLRDRHLHMVEEYGFQREYNRDELRKYFLANYQRLFGMLRKSKALEVPSDPASQAAHDRTPARSDRHAPRRVRGRAGGIPIIFEALGRMYPLRARTPTRLDTTSSGNSLTEKHMTTEADLVFRKAEKITPDLLTEYEREQQRRHEIYQKLKAERLAREATK
jgi:hypothetical protein